MLHSQSMVQTLQKWHAFYDAEQQMVFEAWQGPGYHSTVAGGTVVHPTRESLLYAVGLLQLDESLWGARATAIIRRVLALQDCDPTSRTYGIWSWLLEEPLEKMSPPDWNWADFCGAALAHILIEHAGALPQDLLAETRLSLGHAAWSIFRRNMNPGYTNIALMGAGVTLAAGEVLKEPRLVEYGRTRLRRFVDYTRHHGGFTEYNSPTYSIVALHECERILQLVQDPTVRLDAEAMRRLIWEMIANHYHPATAQWAGPHSRAYSNYIPVDTARYLSEQTGSDIPPHPEAQEEDALNIVKPIPCPADLRPRFHSLLAGEVEVHTPIMRLDGEGAAFTATTWLARDACLGSVNHDSQWTQRRTVLGYWKTPQDPAVVLRLRFLKDGQDFASACVYNLQKRHNILTAIGMVKAMGDFHLFLDKPEDGLFAASDLRVRYELSGIGVKVAELSEACFALSAGDYQAVIHSAPGYFGSHLLKWETGSSGRSVYVDGICYHGKRMKFNPGRLKQVIIAAGLELIPIHQEPASEPVQVEADSIRTDSIHIKWKIEPEMELTVPLRAARTLDLYARVYG